MGFEERKFQRGIEEEKEEERVKYEKGTQLKVVIN